MSVVSGSGGGSTSRPSTPPPKPAAPSKPATPAPAAKSTTSTTSSSASSASTSASTSSSSTSSASKSSSSSTESSKSKETSSSTSSTKDEDKSKESTTSTTDTEDKLETSKEIEREKEEDKDKSFAGKFLDNLRKNFAPESSTVDDQVKEVEKNLSTEKFSADVGRDSIGKLESSASKLEGAKKEKLESRIGFLKKDVAERETSEEKAKAAKAVEKQDAEKSRVAEDRKTKGRKDSVETNVTAEVDEKREQVEGAEKDERGAAPAEVEQSSAARAAQKSGTVDPEKAQVLKQRELESAEKEAKQRLADYRGSKDQDALGSIQRAYDQASENKQQSVQALSRELSEYYPKDKAQELAAQALESKENFYTRYGGLHSVSDEKTREGLSKISPAAGKLAASEDKLKQNDSTSTLARSVEFDTTARETDAQGRVRELKDAAKKSPQKDKNEKVVGENKPEKTEAEGENKVELKDDKLVEGSQTKKTEAEKSTLGSLAKGVGGLLAKGSELVSDAGEKVADAVGGVLGGKSGAEAAKQDAKDPEAAKTENESGSGASALSDPESGEPNPEEVTDGQRRVQASADEAKERLQGYRENGDTEALESIDEAYRTARENRRDTVRTLERELSKTYPEDEAKAMARSAMENKDEFYARYSSLHRTGDEQAKKDLEEANPAAAELAKKEQQAALPDAASQTGNEQVKTVSGAIQRSFQERAKADGPGFRKQLEEAYPDAKPEEINDLMSQARNGTFPVPEDVKFVPAGDEAIGTATSRYDSESGQLALSEDLQHNPAALRQAMLQGSAAHLDSKMGEEEGIYAWVLGDKTEHGAKLMSTVQGDVERLSSSSAVAKAKGFEEATATPEATRRTREGLEREIELALANRSEERNWSEERKERMIERYADRAMRNEDSFGEAYEFLYERGDEETRARLKELNPTLGVLAESRRNTSSEEQTLRVDEQAAGTAYERYRDANSEGPHLDPLSEISKGYQRAQRRDGRRTIEELQQVYKDRGLGSEQALQKAQEAVANEKSMYSQFSSLYKTADEEGKQRLREINPELAGLVDREGRGELKTDDQWRADVREKHGSIPFLSDHLANREIHAAEAKLTTTAQSREQRELADNFQKAIKTRANSDPEQFAQDLRTAYPNADKETVDRLVAAARDGNFPLADKVNFVDKDNPILNGQNASYHGESETIYIDKELLKDPDKVLSAYVEENGHHLDKMLGRGDSQGDEGEMLERSVLGGGIGFLDKTKAKMEDDYKIIIDPDGNVRVIENQNAPPPVVNPGPGTNPVINPGNPGTNPGGTPGIDPVKGPGPITGTPVVRPPVSQTPGVTPPTTGPTVPPSTGTPDPVTTPVRPPVDTVPQPQPTPVRPTPDVSAPKQSPVEPSRDNWKPNRNIQQPEQPKPNDSQDAKSKDIKANFDPNDVRNLDELKRLDDAMGRLKDLPKALEQLDKIKGALKGSGNLGDSLDELKNLTRSMDNLKGLASNLDSLERLGKLQHQLKDLPQKLNNMEQLPSALETLANLNKSMGDLQKLPKMLEQLRDLPTQMAQLEKLPQALNKFNKLPDNLNDVGRLAGFLDAAKDMPGKQVGAQGARLVAADRILPGRVNSPSGVGKSKPTASTAAGTPIVKPTGAEIGGKAGRIAGGGSTVPYVGRFGGAEAGLGPSIGRDASRQTTARPDGKQPPKPIAKKGAIARALNLAGLSTTTLPGKAVPSGPKLPNTGPKLPVGPKVSGAPQQSGAPRAQAPALVPTAEFQQISQRMNSVGKGAESDSLSKLQRVLSTGSGENLKQLPSVLKSLEALPKNMSSVSRLNQMLGKSDGLAQGLAGLKSLADSAGANAQKLQGLDGVTSLLRGVQDQPDAYKGLKRLPGLMNHVGSLGGDHSESVAKAMQVVQNRPEALQGLKNYQQLMNTLKSPEMMSSLEQLNKMVQSGGLEKLAQSGQRLAGELAKPQAVFGLDKLESMFFKARANPEAMSGLDRLGQVLSGRDRQGAAIGVDRLGSLLQTAKSQPNMMRSIVERVVQPGASTVATGPADGGKTSAAGVSAATSPALAKPQGKPAAFGAAGGVAAAQGVGGASAAGAAGKAGAKSPTSLRDYREVFSMLGEIGKPGSEGHPAKLASMSAQKTGAHSVADALEATVVAKPERMLETLKGLTKGSDSRESLGKTLTNLAENTPDRLVGILLLTADVAGGKQALGNMFGELAADPASGDAVGKTFAAATRTEAGAIGFKDLLTQMTAPDQNGDYTGATRTAETFAQATRSKAGARGLAEGFSHLTNLSGGAREVGGLIRQMSRTGEGAKATSEMLMNMASDRGGAAELGKLLSQASKSTAGGRDIIASFSKMASTEAGKKDVSSLMVRLTESDQGAKMLSHMARDKQNAAGLAKLFQQVQESPQAAARMNYALERALNNPNARADSEVFRGRMASDAGLREAVERLSHAPTQSQPLAMTQSARGAEAMARLTAFENLARAVSEKPQDLPLRTVDATPQGPGGGTADGSQGSGSQQQQDNRPFPNQAHPYPDLTAVSDVWKNQSKIESSDKMMEIAGSSAASASGSESEDARPRESEKPSAFRPGDVYSELTLLKARICGDCGFRTSSSGRCARCGFELLKANSKLG